MRILMLGHTGVGKTTYMATMYGAFQKQAKGFGLVAEGNAHQSLLAQANNIALGKYPAPTDQRGMYSFSLTRGGKEVLPFDWIDYRGSALLDTGDSRAARDLVSDITFADAILMFCDSEALATGRARTNQIGRMMNLAAQAFGQRDEILPLALVLTKADLVPRSRKLPQALQGLREAVAASKVIRGALFHVACGRQPLNVEKPVLFVLHEYILGEAARLKWKLKEHTKLKKEYEQRANIFNDVASWFKEEPSFRKRAVWEASEAENLQEQIKPLVGPAWRLGWRLLFLNRF